ncbi:MAG: hypothetical protein L6Q29_00985 [Candidatus Pacebacteria bacterium]|nr:hypothetical protein [Candidatus Paceibacterota bacterium]NUQ57141.1 hypothetical protein [Candidatus Paceibacter sp.]
MFKIIVSIFFVAAAVIIFFTKTKTEFAEVKLLRAKEASYSGAMESSKKIKQSVDKILGDYNQISENERERVDKAIPSKPETMKLAVDLDGLAARSGLTLKSVEVKDMSVSDSGENQAADQTGSVPRGAETVSFTAKLSGSYEAFYSFLRDLEKSLRLTDLKNVKVTSSSAGALEFLIEADTYRQAPERAI